MATNRIDQVQESLNHMPATELTPAQIHRVNAWLAAGRGDRTTERQELERLHAVDPSDRLALERLAQIANDDGQPARASELLERKAEIDRLRASYQKLHARKQPIRDAVEMAHLAEQLGRVFEARVFLTLAISEDPDRNDLRRELERLIPSPARVDEQVQTPAESVADQRDNAGKMIVTPSH